MIASSVIRDDNGNIAIEAHETLIMTVNETMDSFIFESIRDYCEKIVECKIDKRILRLALLECKKNHPDLFKNDRTVKE